jgi:hypothetical protein
MTTIISQETTSTFPITDIIVEALQHVSPKYIPDILSFIQFLEYKSINSPHEDILKNEESLASTTARQVKIAGRLNTMTISDRTLQFIRKNLVGQQIEIIKIGQFGIQRYRFSKRSIINAHFLRRSIKYPILIHTQPPEVLPLQNIEKEIYQIAPMP